MIKRLVALALLLALVVLFACGTEPSSATLGRDHAVGSQQLAFRDTSRPTPANGTEPEHASRDLPVRIWYPALADAGEPETTDAKLDPRGAPYPLVLFVHGSSGTNGQSKFLMQALAAKGYVVAAANFPLTTLLTPGGPSDDACNMQVQDLSFIADQLAAKARDAEDSLHGAVDPSAGYAVMGHSTGGSVALDAAYSLASHDSRVRGIVALAPDACFFSSAMLASRDVPLMVIAGTDDRYNPPSVNAVRAYDLATASPRWLGMLTGGTHLYFTDFSIPDATVTPDMPGDPIVVAFGADEGGDSACTVGPVNTVPDPVIDFALQHALTIQLTQAFLDQWLYGDPTAMRTLTAAHDPALVLQSASP